MSSISIYWIAKAYPALIMIPLIKMPFVGAIITHAAEKVFIDMPIRMTGSGLSYAYNKGKALFMKPSLKHEPFSVAIYPENSLGDWENIELLPRRTGRPLFLR